MWFHLLGITHMIPFTDLKSVDYEQMKTTFVIVIFAFLARTFYEPLMTFIKCFSLSIAQTFTSYRVYDINEDNQTAITILNNIRRLPLFYYRIAFTKGRPYPSDWVLSVRPYFFIAFVHSFCSRFDSGIVIFCHRNVLDKLLQKKKDEDEDEEDMKDMKDKNAIPGEKKNEEATKTSLLDGISDVPANYEKNEDKDIRLFTRTGAAYSDTFYRSTYIKFNADEYDFDPKSDQMRIVMTVENMYKTQKNIIIYVSGPPGCGKSTIPVLLAHRLNGALCNEFNPTIPGESLTLIHMDAEPTSKQPLIVNFSEADKVFLRVQQELVKPNPKVHTVVTDITSLINFMDSAKREQHRNTIIVMSGNLSRDELIEKGIHPAVLRAGRIQGNFTCRDKNRASVLFVDDDN